jgi:hypothetical protein
MADESKVPKNHTNDMLIDITFASLYMICLVIHMYFACKGYIKTKEDRNVYNLTIGGTLFLLMVVRIGTLINSVAFEDNAFIE